MSDAGTNNVILGLIHSVSLGLRMYHPEWEYYHPKGRWSGDKYKGTDISKFWVAVMLDNSHRKLYG